MDFIRILRWLVSIRILIFLLYEGLGNAVKGGSSADDIYELYRKASNSGEFKDLDELMQLKNVKNIAADAGIELEGIKIKIDRDSTLLGKGV
jgi:hypothetical protein